ncbi:organic hydroperoxide resistance protein [Pseudomonas sichuanensis]|uniref:organic hydroperoxide resistance protein n=1 Tax=Pseudomonas TaxID=286 RepID=UPI003805BFCC
MTQQTTILYTARTHTSGGRDGRGQAIDGELDLALSPPGSGRPGSNPEQLLAIGWSACFIGALRRAGQKLEARIPEGVAVDAEVSLGQSADGGFILAAQLTVHLPGLADAQKSALVAMAHQICPYSKATRGNIEVSFVIP